MAMESGESEEPSRLSRRLASPDSNRIRSKTPIMGKNVPRLARHHSEELLLGLDGTPSDNNINNILRGREKGGRLSIEAASFKPTNHHRTASLRRRQKKKKHSANSTRKLNKLNQSEKRSSESSSATSAISGISNSISQSSVIDDLLIDGSNNDNNELENIEIETVERRESDSVKADDLTEALSMDGIDSSKKKEVIRIEVIPDEYKEYKRKYHELDEQIKELEKKLLTKENECNQLKNELNNYKDDQQAQLMAHIEKLLVDVETEEAEGAMDGHEGVKRILSPRKKGTFSPRKNNRKINRFDMPENDSCVMFGLKLF